MSPCKPLCKPCNSGATQPQLSATQASFQRLLSCTLQLMSCAELHVNYHVKSTLSCTELHPQPVNPPRSPSPVAAPLPEPLSFLDPGSCYHLLARIAEAIRVLSGIRLGVADTCRAFGGLSAAAVKVSCTVTFTVSPESL